MTMATQKPAQTRPETASPTPATMVSYTVPTPQVKIPVLVPPLISGAVLCLCYFPVAWGPLAWVALVPLLGLVRSQASPRLIYFSAWLAGSAFFWPILTWMTAADYRMVYCWGLLAFYCSLYFPMALWLTRLLERRTRLPLVVTFSAVWVGLEFARSYLLTGFAWYYLGHSQHEVVPLIQIADVGGVYAVSFLVAAVNAWLFDLLYQFAGLRRLFQFREPAGTKAAQIIEGRELFGEIFRRRIFLEGFAVIVFIGASLGYGHLRLGQERFLPGPRIALLQSNLDQRLRDGTADEPRAVTEQRILAHFHGLCTTAANQRPSPDLIVWPETSYPVPWAEASPKVPPFQVPKKNRDYEISIRNVLRESTAIYRANMLFGMNAFIIDDDGKDSKRNSAVLISSTGNQLGRYDKIHRVPFGEFVPFRDWLPFMNLLSPYDYDYSIRAGDTMARLPLKNYHFGVLICYEDTDPFLARQYGRTQPDGPPVDFLVNISNDGWFDGSSEHEEHLAITRFRAIEARRAVVRAVNMGISAVIDGNGRVLRPRLALTNGDVHHWVVEEEHGAVPELAEADWSRYKKVGGVLTATVPIDDRTSFYALAGDWLPGLCWLLIGAVIALAILERYRGRRVARA